MNKLVCIVGPTGVGKTSKAIELSSKQPSILVSADSRQVYRGMDMVTGKDHPKDVTIYGIDIINPDEQCSVSVWYNSVMPHITKAWGEGALPIVVGGTGLYVKALTEGIDTMQVPINHSLRNELESLSIPELQLKLKEINALKFDSMNNSDSNNPRRLVRAIEVGTAPGYRVESQVSNLESDLIGLKPPELSIYRELVSQRVMSRIDQGAIEETKLLLSKYDKNLMSMSAIGYKSIISYFEGIQTKEEMIEEWIVGELSYAKRQMTWFRKQPVIWYDVDTYANNKS